MARVNANSDMYIGFTYVKSAMIKVTKNRGGSILEIPVNPKLLKLVESLDENIVKAIDEGLNLWLKEKLTRCPVTNKFCTNNQNPCNECNTFTQKQTKK